VHDAAQTSMMTNVVIDSTATVIRTLSLLPVVMGSYLLGVVGVRQPLEGTHCGRSHLPADSRALLKQRRQAPCPRRYRPLASRRRNCWFTHQQYIPNGSSARFNGEAPGQERQTSLTDCRWSDDRRRRSEESE